MSGMYAPGPAAPGTVFPGHRFCGLSALLPTPRPFRSFQLSAVSNSRDLQRLRLLKSASCGRKELHRQTTVQTRCRASSATVVDDIETVEITDSDMLHYSPSSDSAGVDALMTNTLEIQRLSEDLQRQMASLTALTVCVRELLILVHASCCTELISML